MLAPLFALVLSPEPTPADETPSVDLELDLRALPDDDVTKGLEHFLMEHQTEVIEDAGLEVADEAPLVIRIRVSRYGDGEIHSRADIVLVESGGDTPLDARTVECELCRDGDLVMKIGEEVNQLSARVLYSPGAPDDASSEASDETPPGPTDEPRIDGEQDSQPPAIETPRLIGPLGYAGIGALAVGVAGLASGIPLALREDEVRVSVMVAELRSTRPTGIGLASVGGALLATGAVLVSVDVTKRRMQRRVSILPGPMVSGLSVWGRF